MLVNYYVIALMLRVKFMKYTREIGGRKKSREFLWMYYEESVFYSSHEKGRKGLCETHFSSLEHTLNNFTSELSVDYFSECYRMKETCTGNSSRNTGPFMFLS